MLFNMLLHYNFMLNDFSTTLLDTGSKLVLNPSWVNEAEGDATRFKALLGQYERAPDVTRRRLYLETMGELLPKLGGTVVIDEDARQFLPLMNIPAAARRPVQ